MTSAAEPTAPVWPRWEVQGYGTVTCDSPPGGRCELSPGELVPPWVDIRLTFADGARVDVLAVLRDGVIAVEDAQADPPLPLDDLTELGAWIEAPLAYACRAVAGQHHVELGPVTEDDTAAPVPHSTQDAQDMEGMGADVAVAVTEEGEGYEYEGRPTESADAADPAAHLLADEPPPAGRHRAVDPASSDHADRRGVAATYRRAQQLGQDPVLAVMCATGYGRRKSLGLIASARDGGYLTPRHRRR
ncbi:MULTISPECIES: DUF6214 family protein [Streptomyces]|uniref:DUF6214 family protein n=1 Tax=Streptomyces TaxID=1883 RepID=UPI000AB0946B|nr:MULTISPECIES: DUF6214 family protein [Streptomyces]